MTKPDYAVAPGEYLKEWIENNGLSQGQVAERLGCSRKHVNELVNGRAAITYDTVLKLERVVGMSALSWLQHEAHYRSELTRLEQEHELADHVSQVAPEAATYLRSIGATTATKRKPGKLVSDFLTFHRCGTWESYEDLHYEATTGDFALAALR